MALIIFLDFLFVLLEPYVFANLAASGGNHIFRASFWSFEDHVLWMILNVVRRLC